MKIKLLNNLGYSWKQVGNVYYKGKIFYEGKLLSDREVGNLFNKHINLDVIKKHLDKITGIFSIIIDNKNYIYLITDIIRTFPIFYRNGFVSDSAFYICNNGEFLEESIKEFLCTGYVTGYFTLVKNLYQVQAGEIVKINKHTGNVQRIFYHDYITNEIFNDDINSLKEELLNILNRIIDRLINIANGNYIVVPLSGGFDSRLIVSLLKYKGYEKVICYTYGGPWSYEVRISKKVANALGYKWYFVEYNNRTITESFPKEEWFIQYIIFSNNLVSLSHIQDLFAVKYLVDKGLIPENSIFVPGHSGDFLGGSHILKVKKVPDKKDIIHIILKKHYNLCKNNSDLKEKIKKLINYNVKEEFFYSIDENFNMKERQAKFIVNANRVYEYFGFKHYIPLWDRELVDFFKKVPLRYKIEKVLYNDVAISIFKSLGIDFKPYTVELFFYRLLKKVIGIDINNFNRIIKLISKNYDIKYSKNINAFLAKFCHTIINNKYCIKK